jgi:hypothetical protein
MKTLSNNDVDKINNQQRKEGVTLVINYTITTCKQGTIFEPSQVLIKKQQPAVSGLGVESFANQNSGLPWTHVNTVYMEAMNNVQQ